MPAAMEMVKPRRYLTGFEYFVHTCREDRRRKHLGTISSDLWIQCSKQWQEMSEEQQKPFNDASQMDKIRYEHEMEKCMDCLSLERQPSLSQIPEYRFRSDTVLTPAAKAVSRRNVASMNRKKTGRSRAPGAKCSVNRLTKGEQRTANRKICKDKKGKSGKPMKENVLKKPTSAFFQFCARRRKLLKTKHPKLKAPQISKLLCQKWAEAPQKVKDEFKQKYAKEMEVYNRKLEAYNNKMKANRLKERENNSKLRTTQTKLNAKRSKSRARSRSRSRIQAKQSRSRVQAKQSRSRVQAKQSKSRLQAKKSKSRLQAKQSRSKIQEKAKVVPCESRDALAYAQSKLSAAQSRLTSAQSRLTASELTSVMKPALKHSVLHGGYLATPRRKYLDSSDREHRSRHYSDTNMGLDYGTMRAKRPRTPLMASSVATSLTQVPFEATESESDQSDESEDDDESEADSDDVSDDDVESMTTEGDESVTTQHSFMPVPAASNQHDIASSHASHHHRRRAARSVESCGESCDGEDLSVPESNNSEVHDNSSDESDDSSCCCSDTESKVSSDLSR